MPCFPRITIGFFVAVLVAILSGCGRPAGHALPEPPCVSRCNPGVPGGRLTLALAGSPQTFNPLLAVDGPSDAVVRLLFASLVNRDVPTGELTAGLAESWSVESDQKTWTFKLRRGLRWSDGEPLTADDVVFTWNEVMYNPEYNRLTYDLFRPDGTNFAVAKVDDVTVRVVTPEVYAPFAEFFGSVAILPRHILEKAVRANRFLAAYNVGSTPERVVGAGPFRLRKYTPGKSVLLEANPEYWMVDGQGQRLPYFDEVRLEVVEGPAAVMDLFVAGKCDVYEMGRQGDWDSLQQAAAKGDFKILDLGVGAGSDFLWFNQNPGRDVTGQPYVNPARLKWFRDQHFRQAVSCALDRDRMAKEVYGGRARPVLGLLAGEDPQWHNPNVPVFDHDPARARAFLAEMGFEDRNGDRWIEDAEGTPVEFTLVTNTENAARGKMAAMIRDDLQRVGVRVNIQLVDFPLLVAMTSATFTYECALMGFGGGSSEPASQMNLLKSSEPLHQWHPLQSTPATDWEARIDTLMEAQMRTLDLTQRKKDFDEVQAIWAEELPMIGLVAPRSRAAIRSNLGNVRPAATAGYPVTWNADELYRIR